MVSSLFFLACTVQIQNEVKHSVAVVEEGNRLERDTEASSYIFPFSKGAIMNTNRDDQSPPFLCSLRRSSAFTSIITDVC